MPCKELENGLLGICRPWIRVGRKLCGAERSLTLSLLSALLSINQQALTRSIDICRCSQKPTCCRCRHRTSRAWRAECSVVELVKSSLSSSGGHWVKVVADRVASVETAEITVAWANKGHPTS